MFVRWPIGHPMPLSMSSLGTLPLETVPEEFAAATDVIRMADPMDPWKITDTRGQPFNESAPRSYFDPALIPLIYSGGPDEALTDPLGSESGFGIRPTNLSWTDALAPGNAVSAWKWSSFSTTTLSDIPGAVVNPSTAADNITNYDLVSP